MSVIHAPPATAGVMKRKSLERRSARRSGRLAETADGAGLPKGSASVVRQLERTGTRIWIRRGRQISRREALEAWVDIKEQRLGAKEVRVWRAPTREEPHFEPVDEGRKRPDVRSRKRSRPGSSSGPPKSRGRRPGTGVSQSEGRV